MAGAVGNVGDEVEILALGAAEEAVDGVDNDLDDIDVLPFVETADVVGFSNLAFVEDEVDCSCMILNVEPVSYILSLAVYRKRFPVADVVDKERDEFLWELVRAVVV